jgi:hypothetical protein
VDAAALQVFIASVKPIPKPADRRAVVTFTHFPVGGSNALRAENQGNQAIARCCPGTSLAGQSSMDPNHVIHWILYSARRRLMCVQRTVPNGCECAVLYDGLPVATHVSAPGQDLDAWIQKIRSAWESAGWLTAPPAPTP